MIIPWLVEGVKCLAPPLAAGPPLFGTGSKEQSAQGPSLESWKEVCRGDHREERNHGGSAENPIATTGWVTGREVTRIAGLMEPSTGSAVPGLKFCTPGN